MKRLRVLLLTPWDNVWIPLYKRVFEERGHQVLVDHEGGLKYRKADVVLHMWTGMTPYFASAVNLVFMRGFEFYSVPWREIDWSGADQLILCNDYFKDAIDAEFSRKDPAHICPTALVYNVADPDLWAFAARTPGHKIGMACKVHWKKNLPLAAMISEALGPEYEIHVAGEIQDECTANYLAQFPGVTLHGYVWPKDMPRWWEDKSYCLSTSVREGNPNNVLEAMAKGVMPVVHTWPGAEKQFPSHLLFRNVEEAVGIIRSAPYDSAAIRAFTEDRYGLDNFRQVVTLAENLATKKKEKSHE